MIFQRVTREKIRQREFICGFVINVILIIGRRVTSVNVVVKADDTVPVCGAVMAAV